MEKHRALIAPKFQSVLKVFDAHLATYRACWTRPKGGFISLEVPAGCAKRCDLRLERAGNCTPAGATHPHGHDPHDRTIRIAPTFPELSRGITQAAEGVALCVRLAAAKKHRRSRPCDFLFARVQSPRSHLVILNRGCSASARVELLGGFGFFTDDRRARRRARDSSNSLPSLFCMPATLRSRVSASPALSGPNRATPRR